MSKTRRAPLPDLNTKRRTSFTKSQRLVSLIFAVLLIVFAILFIDAMLRTNEAKRSEEYAEALRTVESEKATLLAAAKRASERETLLDARESRLDTQERDLKSRETALEEAKLALEAEKEAFYASKSRATELSEALVKELAPPDNE